MPISFSMSLPSLIAVIALCTPFIIYFLKKYGETPGYVKAISICREDHDKIDKASSLQISSLTIDVTRLIEQQRSQDEVRVLQYIEIKDDIKGIAEHVDKLGSNMYNRLESLNKTVIKLVSKANK